MFQPRFVNICIKTFIKHYVELTGCYFDIDNPRLFNVSDEAHGAAGASSSCLKTTRSE